MKVLIIEDEQLAAEKLVQMIRRYNDRIEVLDPIRSVGASVTFLRQAPVIDLLFLDIHLLDGTCFDLLKEVRVPCPVIFTTAYDEYALEAFRLNSVDYLLKPVSYARLKSAFDKFQQMQYSFRQVHQSAHLDQLLAAVDAKGAPRQKSRFLVKSGSRLFTIDTERIAYFYTEDKISYLVTKDGKKYSISQSLEELETELEPSRFFRINRQMILHIQSIRMVHTYFKGRLKIELQPCPDFDVMVSSRRVPAFKAWLDH